MALPNQADTDALDALIDAWEHQQEGYVRFRSARFEVILDALSYAFDQPATVLDLGCGPGSFSKLILERFPAARTITLDYDPALLDLARHNLSGYADRAKVVEANLMDPAWTETLSGQELSAVVSSTALSWLPVSGLVTLYGQLARLLPESSLFFNADHLSRTTSGPFFAAVGAADDARQRAAVLSAGHPDWDRWWRELRSHEGFAALADERDRRLSDAAPNAPLTPALHTELLRISGFLEAGTIWQHFDDYVVYAVR
ncbi:MAG: class I SAM-dependent methyltransferase [Bifidobacteriaceae bacterium]|jgi:SAM-dependent methyltransferase|nr:class I SAM-dependent methyltransferase [Bifidobacteriaceae bacterium]